MAIGGKLVRGGTVKSRAAGIPAPETPGPEAHAAPMTVVAALGMLAVLLIRNRYLFSREISESGDFALNSLLAEKASHWDLLVGNYSRTGFHHPGPALLYVESFGATILHHWLHVVPGEFNGEILGVFVLNAVLVGLVVGTIYKLTGSITAALGTLAVVVALSGTYAFTSSVWFPFMYMVPFLLLMVAGAALASGATAFLPSYVLAGGLLVHGHVSFVMFVGATSAAVALCWYATHWRGGRSELRSHRRALWGAIGLLAVFLLPMVIEVMAHYPGPWAKYLHYSSHQHRHQIGPALRFVDQYWRLPAAWTVVLVVFGVALVALAIAARSTLRGRFLRMLVAAAILESVLFAVYVIRGVDSLAPNDVYVGYFYRTVPLLVVIGGVAAIGSAIDRRSIPRALVGSAAVAALVFAATLPALATNYSAGTSFRLAAQRLKVAPGRHGREVALRTSDGQWAAAAGIVIAVRRAQVPICVSSVGSANLFTGAMCTSRLPPGGRWALTVVSRGDYHVAGRRLWSNQDAAIVAPSRGRQAARASR